MQQLEAEAEASKNTKISKVLAKISKVETVEKLVTPSKSSSKSKERSRSSSKGKRRYKRRRDDDSSEERKVIKKKEKKKRSQDKAKFSSESEGEADEEQPGKFSDEDGGFGNTKGADSSSPVIKKSGVKPHPASSMTDAWGPGVSNVVSKPPPGSWLDINYFKGKIRIFASDTKKNENQGYSVACHFYTSEPEEVVQQFPDFTKVVTFVFDKYMKDSEEIELHYQRKLTQLKRSQIPVSSQTIMAGWIVPSNSEKSGDVDPKSKEGHKLAFLEAYLSKKPVSISYNPSAGLTVWVVMGKWLKNETLKAIGVKDKYNSDKVIKLDKQLVFFLRRNIEKEDQHCKKLTTSLVQVFDKQKEASLKYVFGTRAENGQEDKDKREAKKHGEFLGGKDAAEKSIDSLDPSMKEMLALLKELSNQEAKEIYDSVSDKNLKQKLRNIIQEYLPDLIPFITDQPIPDADRISNLPPRPSPNLPIAPPIQHPFYPAPMGAPPMKPLPGPGIHHPAPGYMGHLGYDPTKMMAPPGPVPQPGPHPGNMQISGMPYRPPPNMPMNPFMNKPPQMMMPLRPTPVVGAPSGNIGPSPNNLPGSVMNPQPNMPMAPLGYSPLSNPQGPPLNPPNQPHMMYPGMIPMAPSGHYPMMGVPYMYNIPPAPMKPPIMPPGPTNPDSDKISNPMQPPK